jgi:cold shock protein
VKVYDRVSGFGFIRPHRNETDEYVHVSTLERAGISDLHEGQRMTFETDGDPLIGKLAVRTTEIA